MTPVELDKGFLYIEGTRVLVTGTRHHGFYGTVVQPPSNWPKRAQAVILDQWPNERFKFYRHNLIPLYETNNNP